MPIRTLVEEIVIGIVPMLLGVGALAYLPGHDFFRHGFPSPETPDFFPSLVGVFLILLGLGLLVRVRQSQLIRHAAHEAMDAAPAYQTLAIFAAYWLAFNHLGFVASSAIAIVALSKVFHERLNVTTLVFAVSFPLIVHAVFKHSANVYLPSLQWP